MCRRMKILPLTVAWEEASASVDFDCAERDLNFPQALTRGLFSGPIEENAACSWRMLSRASTCTFSGPLQTSVYKKPNHRSQNTLVELFILSLCDH